MEIAERAASPETSTVDLLRQLRIVAARAQLPPLADWVNHELGGYPADAAVPSYRGPFTVEVLGNFVGLAGTTASNVPIAPMSIKERHRDNLFTVTFTQGVAGIEDLLRQGDGMLYSPWPADAVSSFRSMLLQPDTSYSLRRGWALVEANCVLSRSIVTNVLALSAIVCWIWLWN